METVSVTRYGTAQWAEVRTEWSNLADCSPHTTFFVSAEWMDAWIATFGTVLNAEILAFHEGGAPVAVCALVRRTIRYRGFPVRAVYLNTSGETPGESPVIEFNNLVCLPGWEPAVASALRTHIDREAWDEFHLDGFCPGPPLEALRQVFQDTLETSEVRANYFVDLDPLRESGTPYENTIGSKERARLRQNLRYYGGLEVEVAASAESATRMLDEIVQLNHETWAARGKAGVFMNPRFAAFHRKLLETAFPSGLIQLARVTAGSQTVGLLYNMVYGGHVYYYQSGFKYAESKRVRPGAVTIACVIQHCLTKGELRRFNFMAGTDHYKRPLASGSDTLEWVVLQKRNLRTKAMRGLRHLWGKWKARRAQPESAGDQEET
jgi:hypothetical protein